MAYITTNDLLQRLGTTMYARLTDRVSGATADETVAQQIVDDAEAEADSYLARRYATPVDLASHPELENVLAVRVLDLAEHAAWQGSPFVGGLPQRVQSLREAAVRWFADVAAGRLVLPADGVPASTQAAADTLAYRSAERTLTADELDGL